MITSARAAAIDIGTNSVLLLVAERRGGELVPLVERATITRLGKGVDATRTLDPDAVTRTLECLARYGEELRAAGATELDVVGTSAMRDARGGEAFAERARVLLGRAPRVISGDEEARVSFSGALSGLDVDAGPVCVFDVGGGSTEIILGDAAGGVKQAASLDVGSVRLTERHVRRDPPTSAELEAVRADVRAALGTLAWALGAGSSPPTLVGVAGTVTTLAAIARDVVPYDGARVHGARLRVDELADVAARLAVLPLTERRAVRGLDPARADVIVAGAALALEIVRASGAPEVVVSDRGVRWGLIRALLG